MASRFIAPPAARPQSEKPKRPAPRKKPVWPQQREAKASRAAPIRRGR